MKTSTGNQKSNLSETIFVMILMLTLISKITFAQEPETPRTLLKSNVIISEVFTPEVKINSIQGTTGTLVGFYAGPMINNTYLIGFCGGVNLGHPRVNYGYFGGIVQYIYKSSNLVHFSGQMVAAYGTTKDYENPKSGLLDNFWNISGARFFMTEPGANIELNLKNGLTLVAGVSYRYVSGLNENDENVSITHVTNSDLSGTNFTIGLKICRGPKNRQK